MPTTTRRFAGSFAPAVALAFAALSPGVARAADPPGPVAVKPPPAPPALDRIEFNRLAAELALPLFWRADADTDGVVDPDEVAYLWGVRPASKPEEWTDGKAFTAACSKALAELVARRTAGPPAGKDAQRRSFVLAELAQGRPTLVENDFSAASPEDRAIVDHVLKAAVLVETIHQKQNGVFGWEKKIPAGDAASRMLFYRNQGPFCAQPKTENEPACSALPGAPRRVVGIYPKELQQDPKFCEALQARPDQKTLTAPFVVVKQGKQGLTAVPYSVEYRAEMAAISRELLAAANAVTSPGEVAFKTYLTAASRSFLDNDWEPADEAWSRMGVSNSKWYLRIGPDETYWEPCSLKAGFHVSFGRINQDSVAWQKKLEPVKTAMENELAALAGPPYKARAVSFHLPDFVDIVLNAGDSRSPTGATIGQSLPNWGPVANEGRGRTVAMTNLYTDEDSKAAYLEQVGSLFCKESMAAVTFDNSLLTMSTVLHEAAHNLGPAHEYAVDGKTDDVVFGGPLASMLEELKAQTAALYFTDWLVRKQAIDRTTAERTHVRDLTWAFGHIAQGMYTREGKPKAYSQLAAIQVGAFLKGGIITWEKDTPASNGTDRGCLQVHLERLEPAIRELAKIVLRMKSTGDRARAETLTKVFVDDPGPWKDLRDVIAERWGRAPKASFVYAVR